VGPLEEFKRRGRNYGFGLLLGCLLKQKV